MLSGAHGDELPRVLVVDDEDVIREILADFLSMEGYWVRTAADGAEAVEELSRRSYDLVLTDLKMPKVDGLELLRKMLDDAPGVVSIVMTGFGTVESAIEAMKQGAYDYIMKPFKVEHVIHTIRRGLEKRRLHTENMRLKETVSLYRVNEAIASSLSLEQVLYTVTDGVIGEMRADLVLIFLEDGDGGFYERSRVASPDAPFRGSLGTLDIGAVVQHSQQNQAAFRLDGTRGVKLFRTPPDEALLQSMIVAPLRVRDSVRGYVCAFSFTPGRTFDEGQRKLVTMITDRAAAAIENARLYENLKATFHQTIRGLASAIDKMDRYTAGHSERVANYAHRLSLRLGIEEEQSELIKQSALMHDIGKVGCVLNLNKAGPLTNDEYEEFKRHTIYGRDILEPIKFLNPLIPGVYLHHERWDGKGYPTGIGGEEIPLMARVITVADSYDAMTTDRAYRRAFTHEEALREIQRCTGTQFDPQIAPYFEEAIAELNLGHDSNDPVVSEDANTGVFKSPVKEDSAA